MALRPIHVLSIGVALLISACESSEAIYLKHPGTGDTVKCGPYTAGGNIPHAQSTVQKELRYCVEDFIRQGYHRLGK